MSDTELAHVAVRHSAPFSTPIEDLERTHQPSQDEDGDVSNAGRVEQELAPVDGGSAAWRLLCAAFVFEALLWGKTDNVDGTRYVRLTANA